MNMPGLSAQASLYRSSRQYVLGTGWAGAVDSGLGLSQLPPPTCVPNACVPNPAAPGTCHTCTCLGGIAIRCSPCECPCDTPPVCGPCEGGSCGCDNYPTCARTQGTITCRDCHGNITSTQPC